jgi:group I intron endonuclease
MNSGIYIIRNIINNKMYVGSTGNFVKREKQHFKKLYNRKHNLKFQNAYNKYGKDNFKFEIIQLAEYDKNIVDLEDYWIKILDSKKSGYNIADASFGDTLSDHPNKIEIKKKISNGLKKYYNNLSQFERNEKCGKLGKLNGMFGKTHSAETKKIISKANKDFKIKTGHGCTYGIKLSKEHCAKISALAKLRTGEKNPFYGKKHTEETKKIFSLKATGRTPANVKAISIDGIIYPSRRVAAEQLKIKEETLWYRANSANFKNIFWI